MQAFTHDWNKDEVWEKWFLYLKVGVGAQGEVVAIAPDGHESWEVQGGALGHDVLHCIHCLLWWEAMFTCNPRHTYCVRSTDSVRAVHVCDQINTNSVLHWCWSATWPLTSGCWLPWPSATSCWPYQPVWQSPPSPRETGLAQLGKERRDSAPSCCFFLQTSSFRKRAGEPTHTYPKVCWHYSSVDGRWNATWFLDRILESEQGNEKRCKKYATHLGQKKLFWPYRM